jgi:hypothetical protein
MAAALRHLPETGNFARKARNAHRCAHLRPLPVNFLPMGLD